MPQNIFAQTSVSAQLSDFSDSLIPKAQYVAQVFQSPWVSYSNIQNTPADRQLASINISTSGFKNFFKKTYCNTISLIGITCSSNIENKTISVDTVDDGKTFYFEGEVVENTVLNKDISVEQNTPQQQIQTQSSLPVRVIEQITSPIVKQNVLGMDYDYLERRLFVLREEILGQNQSPIIVRSSGGGVSPRSLTHVRDSLQEQIDALSSSSLADLSGFTTSDLEEGSNLYYTDARAVDALTGQNISLFLNDSNYLTSISGLNISDLNNDSNFISNLSSFTTDDLTQGSTNLYSQWATNGSDISFVGGNVGVGTTTPLSKLTLADSVSLEGGLSLGSDVALYRSATGQLSLALSGVERMRWALNGGTGQFQMVGDGNPAAPKYSWRDDSDTGLHLLGPNIFGISTGGTNRLAIDANGNIGIGTTTPAARLSVKGVGTGTGLLAQFTDSADVARFTVLDNGNVGVGTSTPTSKLHISDGNSVASSLYTTDYQIISAQSTAPGFNIISAASGAGNRGVFKATRANGTLALPTAVLLNDQTFSLLGAAFDGTAQRATAGITFLVDGTVTNNTQAPQSIVFETGLASRSEQMRITSSGNIGIGTTAPSQKLHVDGSIQIGTSAFIRNRLGLGSIRLTDNATVFNEDGLDLDFRIESDTDAQAFVVDGGTGNVGVGTISPQSKLHIGAGTSGVSSFDTNSAIILEGNANASAGQRFLTFYHPSNTADYTGFAWGDENDTFVSQIGYRHSDDSFRIYANNGERLVINSTGNVGIGTTTPAARLSVKGVGTGTGLLANFTDSADVARFTVLDNGNVGVGTTNPSAKLQVNGDFMLNASTGNVLFAPSWNTTGNRLSMVGQTSGVGTFLDISAKDNDGTDAIGVTLWAKGSTAVDRELLEFRWDNGNSEFAMNVLKGSSATSRPLSLYTDNNRGQLFLATSGNIGIGTTTPAARLSVKGAGTGTGLLSQFTDSADVARFTVLDNGNVGVGTTTPSGKLHVADGNVVFSGSNILDLSGLGSSSGIVNILKLSNRTVQGFASGFNRSSGAEFFNLAGGFVDSTLFGGGVDGDSYRRIRILADGSIKFGSGSVDTDTTLQRVSGGGLAISGGNLGIGTTTPSHKLAVAGDINFTGDLYQNGVLFSGGGGDVNALSVIAVGNTNTNTGTNASAFGYLNNAQTLNSVLIGNQNFTSTGGFSSVSLGILNNSTGATIDTTTGVITGTAVATTTVGVMSSSVGVLNSAKARSSSAFGYANIASGNGTVAFGTSNQASNNDSVAVGGSNRSSGDRAVSIGYLNRSTNTYSSAVGYENSILGNMFVTGASAFGYLNSTNAGQASAFGASNNITESGFRSSAFGYNNIISSENASAFGHSNNVSANNASAFGNSITNNITSSTMIGPSNSAKITILSSGNTGIGTTTPSEKLSVVGSARFTAVGSGVSAFDLNLTADGVLTTAASDERLKTNIQSLDSIDVLDRIMQLDTRSFEWKSNSVHDIGLIAQEVEIIFPELVFTNPTDGYKGINYSKFPTLLISALQELVRRVSEFANLIETKLLKSDKIETQELCIDGLCVTRDQLEQILQGGGNEGGNNETTSGGNSEGSTSGSDGGSTSDSDEGSTSSDSNTDEGDSLDNTDSTDDIGNTDNTEGTTEGTDNTDDADNTDGADDIGNTDNTEGTTEDPEQIPVEEEVAEEPSEDIGDE